MAKPMVMIMLKGAALVLLLAAGPDVMGQYQLVREDPFAALSSTLVTRQAAACDGEFAHLRCPVGAKVHIFFFCILSSRKNSINNLCPSDILSNLHSARLCSL